MKKEDKNLFNYNDTPDNSGIRTLGEDEYTIFGKIPTIDVKKFSKDDEADDYDINLDDFCLDDLNETMEDTHFSLSNDGSKIYKLKERIEKLEEKLENLSKNTSSRIATFEERLNKTNAYINKMMRKDSDQKNSSATTLTSSSDPEIDDYLKFKKTLNSKKESI